MQLRIVKQRNPEGKNFNFGTPIDANLEVIEGQVGDKIGLNGSHKGVAYSEKSKGV